MKGKTKLISMAVVLAMALSSAFTGCTSRGDDTNKADGSATVASDAKSGGKQYNGVDISKEVKIKWMGIGGNQKDKDTVLAEINKSLKEKVNATMELDSIDWSDYQNKYRLVLSSGEDYDVIYAAQWIDMRVEARKGAYKDLTSMMEKYAPYVMKTWPKEAWAESKIDDKIYMIPSNSDEYDFRGLMYREDLRKKYNVPEIKEFKDLEAYFEAIKKNEKGMVPFKPSNTENWVISNCYLKEKGIPEANPLFFKFAYNDKDCTSTKYQYEIDTFVEAYKICKAWADKGYWPKDSIANKVESVDSFKQGVSASCQGGYWKTTQNYKEIYASHPDWEIGMYVPTLPGNLYERPSYQQNGIAILANSNRAERTLMAIDAIYSDKDLLTLCMHGIKGKHYDLDANGGKITLPVGKAADYDGNAGYFSGMRQKMYQIFKDDPKDPTNPYKEEFKKNSFFPVLGGFVPNTEPIKNEVAAVGAVEGKYVTSLNFGLAGDVDKAVAEYASKMKAAGSEKVREEIAKQIKDYMASQKK